MPSKYRFKMVRDHPFIPTGLRYVHQIVMAEYVGRWFRKNEHVHHKNGDGKDNRLENLELLTAKVHRSKHRKPCSEETKRKISQSNTGKVRSLEVRQRYSLMNKGRKRSAEFRAKVSKGMKKYTSSLPAGEMRRRFGWSDNVSS